MLLLIETALIYNQNKESLVPKQGKFAEIFEKFLDRF